MYYPDPLMAKVFLDPRRRQAAEQVGYPIPTGGQVPGVNARPSNRVARSSRRLAVQVGARLVRLGERLERYGRPPQKPEPLDGWHGRSRRTTLHQEA